MPFPSLVCHHPKPVCCMSAVVIHTGKLSYVIQLLKTLQSSSNILRLMSWFITLENPTLPFFPYFLLHALATLGWSFPEGLSASHGYFWVWNSPFIRLKPLLPFAFPSYYLLYSCGHWALCVWALYISFLRDWKTSSKQRLLWDLV